MGLCVDGEWEGWDGETVVELNDGSEWEQVDFYYEYRYAYRPSVTIVNGGMLVEGMRRAVRVRRI